MKPNAALLSLCLLSFIACGPSEVPGAPDAGSGDQTDAGPTLEPDAGPTLEPDAGPTLEPDAGPSEEPDAGPSEEPDSGPIPEPDAGPCPDGYTGDACDECADDYQDVDGDDVCLPTCEAGGDLLFSCGFNGECAIDEDNGSRFCVCHVGFVFNQDDVCVLSEPPSNMTLWLDASDTDSVTHTSNALTKWSDTRSSLFGSFAPPAVENRPYYRPLGLNGRRVVRFDGVADHLVGTAPLGVDWFKDVDAYTIFIVGFAKGGSQMFVSGTSGNNPGLRIRSDGAEDLSFMHRSPIGNVATDQDVVVTTGGGYSRTQAHLFSVLHATGFHAASHGRGDTNIEAVAGAQDPFAVGLSLVLGRASPTGNTSDYLEGDLAEVLIYFRALNADEVTQAQDYLTGKWGLE